MVDISGMRFETIHWSESLLWTDSDEDSTASSAETRTDYSDEDSIDEEIPNTLFTSRVVHDYKR